MKRLIILILAMVFILSGCVTQADVDKARREGYDVGYSDGENRHQKDYQNGYDDGLAWARSHPAESAGNKSDASGITLSPEELAWLEGYNAGFEEAMSSTDQDFYDAGWDAAIDYYTDNTESPDYAYEQGYNDGYYDGYNDARNETED